MTSLTSLKWADQIFPGFGLVWKEKRHILVSLDEKVGTGHITHSLSLSGERFFAPLRMTKPDGPFFEMSWPLWSPAVGKNG